MKNNKLIDEYNKLRNTIILNARKKQFLKKENNNYLYLDLLNNSIGTYSDFIGKNACIIVGGNIKNPFYFKTGNLDEAYLNLINKIGTSCSKNISTEEELINILNKVYTTIIEYFGYGNLEERKKYYEVTNSRNITLESLKGKNLAVCLEDAVLAQNMLKLLGFNSTLKVSLVQYKNGKYDTHAYNLIKFKNKNYLFDSRFPSLSGPVVSFLTEEDYLNLIYGLNESEKIVKTDNEIIYFTSNIPLREVTKNNNKLK